MQADSQLRVLALAGGVGGAKLSAGLAAILGERLTVLVNTGDDFEHFGLHVSPDLDTVLYTLAGLANPTTGWGLEGETWNFMSQLSRLGGPTWFRLGDRDLATHAIRTAKLRQGESLTSITAGLTRALNVRARILPMSDDSVRTFVGSKGELIAFQDYFVRLKCEVPVDRLHFDGTETARFNPAIADLLGTRFAIIICPSNPYLSIDPILSLPGLKTWIKASGAPVIAVSPIVGGAAIKGPAAKIMNELGLTPSALTVARHYKDLVGGFMIDACDAGYRNDIAGLGMAAREDDIVMRNDDDRVRLARNCLQFAEQLMDR
jgi:LPPG:FO 2-phospho-L-lactate transferase